MSDNWLMFISTDPYALPTEAASESAVGLLKTYAPNALGEIVARVADRVEFHSGGGNWSGVRCPSCDADLEAWWSAAVDEAWASEFRKLAVTTPCCGHPTTLNDLSYVSPAGFSLFVLQALNPNISDTTPEQDRALAEALGFELRKVWTHI
ncbi:MAG: hypothetical protein ABMA14_21690 [Hyphomonadaceae bacterium]